MNIIRSSQFKVEIKAILQYIAKDKKSAARDFSRKLQLLIDSLPDNPKKGRLAQEGHRELIYKGYVLPYLIDDEKIVILGIFNQNEWYKVDN